MNNVIKSIKHIQQQYTDKAIDAQTVIDKLTSMQNVCMKHHMNMYNYLYRNGILNKSTAILSAKDNIQKYQEFSSHKIKFEKELNMIKNSKQKWFNNYGVHDSPFHDLIKPQLDKYKVDGLLSSLLCDLYVGTYNEGSVKPLMLFSNK